MTVKEYREINGIVPLKPIISMKDIDDILDQIDPDTGVSYSQLLKNQKKLTGVSPSQKGNKPSKMHNIKTNVDGHIFDSKKEAKYYEALKLNERMGLIKDLVLQPEFELQEHFRWGKEMQRAIIYRADFQYYDIELDKIVIVDVKASKKFTTDVYKIKKKMFLYNFIEPQRDLYMFKEVY